MNPPKVTSKFTKEELNGKFADVDIRDSTPPLSGKFQIESWTHPDGDGLFIGLKWGVAFKRDSAVSLHTGETENGPTTSMDLTTYYLPQRHVDLIERNPDQSAEAAFVLHSPAGQ